MLLLAAHRPLKSAKRLSPNRRTFRWVKMSESLAKTRRKPEYVTR